MIIERLFHYIITQVSNPLTQLKPYLMSLGQVEHNMCGDLFLQYGHVYLAKKENANALIYFKKALDQFNKNNNTLKKAWSYYSLAKVYLAEKAYTEAGKYFKLADEIRDRLAKCGFTVTDTAIGTDLTFKR